MEGGVTQDHAKAIDAALALAHDSATARVDVAFHRLRSVRESGVGDEDFAGAVHANRS